MEGAPNDRSGQKHPERGGSATRGNHVESEIRRGEDGSRLNHGNPDCVKKRRRYCGGNFSQRDGEERLQIIEDQIGH